MFENCYKCAKLLRLNTCTGNVKVCPGFLDNRAGCNKCIFVNSCKQLGKHVGILHVCSNFQLEKDKSKRIPLKDFSDYQEFLDNPRVIPKKRGRPKGSLNKFPRKIQDKASELLTQYEQELQEADDKAMLVDYTNQPANWSAESLTDKIISANYDPRLFELVNEQDIPKATNPVQFIIDPRFLNISLFPMQLKISLEYFSSYCPDCSNTKYIKNAQVDTPVDEILDRTVLYVNGICPKCGKTRYEHIKEGKHHNYNTLVGISGQRSGKSIYHGIIAAAVLHQYLSLPNPVTFMKSVQQATFTMTFVGLRFQDAYDNLWRDFYANITNSPWFSLYNQFLTDEGIRLGKPLIKQADTFVTYIGKRIAVNPAGPDKRKLRGRCVVPGTFINTNKGLIRAGSKTLKNYLVYSKGNYYKCKNKKQQEKECVKCYFSNGLHITVSTDHRIPCYDLDIYLTEAKDLKNKYVMCQLGGGFGDCVNNDIIQSSKQDVLNTIKKHMCNPFEINSYSRRLQLSILKFCACYVQDNKIRLSKYDANILASLLGNDNIHYDKIDCVQYLIPGTDVYTKSKLNKMFNISVPEHLTKYIDKNIIFVKCVKVENVGFHEVYDIEVESKDHLFSADGILVHNTRIFGSIDEISWFFGKDASMTLDADEVATALENSLKTVRNSSEQLISKYPDIPNAHAVYISSPRSKLDKGMRLLKQCSYVPSMYGWKTSTWNFNPNFTKESFKDEYARDPIAAETNFGANPPFGDRQYISNPAAIINVLSKKPNVFEVIKYNTIKDSLGGLLRYPAIRIRPHGLPSVVAIDAGYNNNSFAIVLMHYIQKHKFDEIQNVPACSGIIEIQPEEGIAVSFPKIYELVISKIIQEFNVQIVAFDRWQSIDLRQRVYEDFEIDALQYSVNMQDFENLRTDILSENFILPRCESEIKDIISLDKEVSVLVYNKPITHLILQLLTSRDTGRIITKGEETSDDILRALCLAHSILIDEDYQEFFNSDIVDAHTPSNFLGLSVNYSNSRGNVNALTGIGCKISY